MAAPLKVWMKAVPVYAICLSAVAQTSTSDTAVQEQLRQQQRERVIREQHEREPDVRLERPADAAANSALIPQLESPCFRIDRIALNGDAADQFQWALAFANPEGDPATGRCLGAAGINVILKRVQNAVLARGFVTTRILAGQQDLNSGTLVLTVIPGRIRAIRLDDATPGRATGWNALPVKPGDILNLRDIEQGLENFKRVPTADADIQIEPAGAVGAKPGESDLVIRYQQALPFRLALSADDSGTRHTGKYQGGLTFSFDNWWTLNDLFYASINRDLGGGDAGDRGTQGSTVHYSVPFGYWLLGVTTSRYRYHQAIAGANQTYIYSGTNQTGEIRVSRILFRDASRKTTASLRGFARKSNNFIDDTEIEVQRRRTAGWELGVAHRELLGKTTLDGSVGYRRGTGARNSMAAPEEAFGEGTARPVILTADAVLTVPFKVHTYSLRYSGALRMQWNRTPLVPQDRFAIGGRYTVRGFDGESVLSADRGRLLRNDLGVALGQSGQELYLGVDYGEVRGRSSEYLLGTYLAGAVVGMRGGYRGIAYDLFAGQPVKKPQGFTTASTTVGFNLNWSY